MDKQSVDTFDAASIEKGGEYRDKRGREWTVLSWLRRDSKDRFFIDCEREYATHLHAYDMKRHDGKFTPIKSFAKTIAETINVTA